MATWLISIRMLSRTFLPSLGLLFCGSVPPVYGTEIYYHPPQNLDRPSLHRQNVSELSGFHDIVRLLGYGERVASTLKFMPLCSATMVDARTFLTAAHCLRGLPRGLSHLTLRKLKAGGAFEDLAVDLKGIQSPEDERLDVVRVNIPGTVVVDFAVQHTGVGIVYETLPVATEPNDSPAGTDFVALGYGPLDSNSSVDTLRLSQTWHRLKNSNSRDKFLSFASFRGSTCFGDSGGPVLKEVSATRYQLVGVITHTDCRDRTTAVSVPFL